MPNNNINHTSLNYSLKKQAFNKVAGYVGVNCRKHIEVTDDAP
ncbi:MAG: hypothetical protein WBN37_08875 [Arenicellales bacterium]